MLNINHNWDQLPGTTLPSPPYRATLPWTKLLGQLLPGTTLHSPPDGPTLFWTKLLGQLLLGPNLASNKKIKKLSAAYGKYVLHAEHQPQLGPTAWNHTA
jgi:hypothetical protein